MVQGADNIADCDRPASGGLSAGVMFSLSLAMKLIAARSIGVTLLGTCVVVGFFWWMLGDQYSLRSSQASPDGQFSVFEFRSHQNGREHAPHGSVLSLSADGSLGDPEDGHVIFAGYCKTALSYQWVDDQHIAIDCELRGDRDLRSLAHRAFGISVSLNGR